MKDEITIPNSNVENALNFIAKPTNSSEIPTNEPPPPPEEPTPGPQEPPPVNKKQQYTTDPLEDITDEVAEETTETLIYLMDFAITVIGKFFARRKFENKAYEIAGYNAAEKMKEVLKKVKQKDTAILDKEEAALRDLHEALEDYLKEVPLDESEQKLLRKPLKDIVKIKHMKMSPGFTLMVSLAMIATSRITGYSSI